MRFEVNEDRAEALARLEDGCSVAAGSLLPATFEKQVDQVRRSAAKRLTGNVQQPGQNDGETGGMDNH